jgi:hypothetical protein
MDGLKELNNAIQRKLGDKKKDTEIDPDVHAALQAEPEIAADDPFDDEADKNNPNLIPTVESCFPRVVNRRWLKYCGGDMIRSQDYR